MSMTLDRPAESRTLQASVNYVAPSAERLRNVTFESPDGLRTNVVPDPREVTIRDARPIASRFSLDEHGFAILRHTTAMRSYDDEAAIRGVVYPEAARLLRAETGADRVHIFDHTLRRRVPGQEDRSGGLRQPVTRVHVDQTERSGPKRVRDLLPDEAETLLRGRVQIINLWRPLRGPVLDAPLAMADAQSFAAGDLLPADLVYPDRMGELYYARHNPAHRWFYLSRMQSDEVLLLKCYDSATDGRARFVPHTAFLDPTTPPDAPPRESIELRALVFHRD